MAETNRESEHKPEYDHGQDVKPYREVSDDGWLVCPDNKDKYTGENRPWRQD